MQIFLPFHLSLSCSRNCSAVYFVYSPACHADCPLRWHFCHRVYIFLPIPSYPGIKSRPSVRFPQINLHISKNHRTFAADIGILYTMMQLVNNGTVLLEREKPHVARTNTMTLRAKRLSHGIKKTVRPQPHSSSAQRLLVA